MNPANVLWNKFQGSEEVKTFHSRNGIFMALQNTINCQSAPAMLTIVFVKPIYLTYFSLTSFSWNGSLKKKQKKNPNHYIILSSNIKKLVWIFCLWRNYICDHVYWIEHDNPKCSHFPLFSYKHLYLLFSGAEILICDRWQHFSVKISLLKLLIYGGWFFEIPAEPLVPVLSVLNKRNCHFSFSSKIQKNKPPILGKADALQMWVIPSQESSGTLSESNILPFCGGTEKQKVPLNKRNFFYWFSFTCHQSKGL